MNHTHTHTHTDERGLLVKCYHQCRHWLSPGFLAGWIVASTITFPLEHIFWFRTTTLSRFAHWCEGGPLLSTWLSITIMVVFVIAAIIGIIYAVEKEHN